jgi:hypothetical protein
LGALFFYQLAMSNEQLAMKDVRRESLAKAEEAVRTGVLTENDLGNPIDCLQFVYSFKMFYIIRNKNKIILITIGRYEYIGIFNGNSLFL